MQDLYKQYGWEVKASKQVHQGLINSTYMVSTVTGDFIFQTMSQPPFF